eukprot:TRINITY_DN32911_c0_g1_i1.p1 TRINITY_DN32911_c0_g1~~TRINITY_DN32911_c0_g1_i1.p1  ORF type:complete len:427 (-),score=71.92 TRINITY_DN32911_c0_g1_i1:89-1369(-)
METASVHPMQPPGQHSQQPMPHYTTGPGQPIQMGGPPPGMHLGQPPQYHQQSLPGQPISPPVQFQPNGVPFGFESATPSGRRIALQSFHPSIVSCLDAQQGFQVLLSSSKTISKADLLDVHSMPQGNVCFRSVATGGFLAVDPMTGVLGQRSARFHQNGVTQVAPLEASLRVMPAGQGRVHLFSVACQQYIALTNGVLGASQQQLGPQTSFFVHRFGVPPPPPPPHVAYHIHAPKKGHPGQRKYARFTGAIQCPKCNSVLGVDPETTFCQCAVCHSNLNARYCKPVGLADGSSYATLKKKHKKKHKKDHKKGHSGSDMAVMGLVGVYGGVLVADSLPEGTFSAVGRAAVQVGETAEDGAVVSATLASDAVEAVWEDTEWLETGGEFVVDGAVGGAGLAADGAEALWDTGVLPVSYTHLTLPTKRIV